MASKLAADAERSFSSSEVSLSYRSSSSHGSWKHLLHVDGKQNIRPDSEKSVYRKHWFRVLTFLLVLGVIAILLVFSPIMFSP